MDFGIAETGIARGSPPRTITEVLRVGFPFAEIRFVSWAALAGTGKWRGKRGLGVLSFFLVFFKTLFHNLNSNSFQNTSRLFQYF
jgi:hypothetical protein